MREPGAKPGRGIFLEGGGLRGPGAGPGTGSTGERETRNTEQGTRYIPRLLAALTVPSALEKSGVGALCILSDDRNGKVYGRALTVADRLGEDRVIIAKWIRRLTNWNG